MPINNPAVGGGDMNMSIYDSDEDGVIEGTVIQLLKEYEISDDLYHSHDAEVIQTGDTYTKHKTITLDTLYKTPKTLRIKFDLKRVSGTNASGRLRKNGAVHGTERITTSTTYVTYSEDLEYAEGETIELWLSNCNVGQQTKAENLRIYGIDKVVTLQDALTNSNVGKSSSLVGTNT